MEAVDLGLGDLEPITLNLSGDTTTSSAPSVNFGAGVELLMNEKKKPSSGPISMDLADLDNLEKELNDLSSDTANMKHVPANSSSDGSKTVGMSGLGGFAGFSNFFGLGGSNNTDKQEPVNVHIDNSTDSNIGAATSSSMGNTKTWDGFTKLTNEIPGNSQRPLNEREKRRKKRAMLKKLDEWYEKGLTKQSSNFTMDSNYEEVEDEYETMLEDKRKKESIKLQQWWFMTAVNSLEYMNSSLNPFDINLDGWGEQVSEDIDSYDEIFAELHEKYKGGKLAPELSLLLRLGFSAAMVNFSNRVLSSATPAFNDVIRGNPELMRMFTDATAQSMSKNSPGFAMASNLVRGNSQTTQADQGPSRNMGPPPAPVETRGMPAPTRPGQETNFVPQNRPDISMARGASAVDLNQPYANPNANPMMARPEMKGPSTDINNILSGLKTRTVDMHPPTPTYEYGNSGGGISDLDDSLISAASLKDMQNMNGPKRTNRRRKHNGSDKNTIALDI